MEENKITAIVGRKIKTFREERDYNQQYMADKLEISQSDYSKIEKGAVKVDIERLYEIAKILDTSLNNILGFDQSKMFHVHDNTTEKGIIGVSGNVVFPEGIMAEIKALYEKLIAEKDKLLAEKDKLNQHIEAENKRLKEEIERLKKG